MLGLVKLLYSLSKSLPVLREILIDLVSLIKDINSNKRLDTKNAIVNSRIDSFLYRMHNNQTGERKPPNEQG